MHHMDCPSHRLRSCHDEGLSGCGGLPLPLWAAALPPLPHPSFPSDRHLISRVSVNNTKEPELQQGSSLKPRRCFTSQLVFLQAAAKAACDRAPWHGTGLPGRSPGRLQAVEETLYHPPVRILGGHLQAPRRLGTSVHHWEGQWLGQFVKVA